MPLISNYATADKQFKTIQEHSTFPLVWKYFNTNYKGVTTINSSDLGSTTIGGGEVETKFTGQPQATNQLFSFRNTRRPLTVNNSKSYKNIAATTTGDGRKFAIPTVSIADDEFIRLTVRPNSNSLTATVVLESTTNSDTLTFAGISLTHIPDNTWGTITLSIAKADSAGTIDYTTFKALSIALSGSGNIDFYELQIANNPQAFVGQVNTTEFNCLTERSQELDRSIEDIKCYNMTQDTSVSDMSSSFTITTSKFNLKHYGSLFGENVVNKSDMLAPAVLNGNGGYQKVVVTAGAFDLGQQVNPQNLIVRMGGEILQLVSSPNIVDESSFYATPSGAFTVSTSYNGSVATVVEIKQTEGHYFTAQDLQTSFEGAMLDSRVLANGQTFPMHMYKVQMANYNITQDDGSASAEIEFRILPVFDGNRFKFFDYGIV